MAAQFMAGAAQFVGEAFLASSIQSLCDRMRDSVFPGDVSRFICGRNLNEELLQNLLEKLMITMNSVYSVLEDAEERQITDRRVKNWLDELRDVVYEADDFLDLISYGSLKFQLECTNQVRNTSDSFTPLEDVSEENVKNVLEKLEYLVKQKNILCLREGIGEKTHSQKIPTTSIIDESGVYGRNEDKAFIMKLLQQDDANCYVPGVIPFVGMGGIGKTTLAQLVFNDGEVHGWFELKAWVCVSEEFDVFKVTKDLLQEVSSVACNGMNFNQLQQELRKILQGKKFLIVLDDIWNEKYRDWDILRAPLTVGKQGSKVIITTRNQSVASVMRTFPSHHMKELDHEDCWSLFAKHAFYDGNPSAYPRLEAIGKEIIKKVGGLPLAAKTLGGLLRCERDARKWEKIWKSNLWDLQNNEILPALQLSYYYLPSHLKRCFAYCAIFPKDFEFQKDEIVLLWMAEGFVDKSERHEEVTEDGEDYFNDLISRSFLQESGSRSCFVMHDLIHDLATYVSGQFCCRLEDSTSTVSKKVRHLSCARPFDVSGIPLRTLICKLTQEFEADWFLTFRCLRVLSLGRSYGTCRLPDSIGNLIHLRYLNLSGASFQALPDYVTSLYNLQSLILRDCKSLDRLPTKFSRLINLCCLDIRNTNLKFMPPNLGLLKKLQLLTNFIVQRHVSSPDTILSRNRGLSSIRELGKLQHLKGKLVIYGVGRILDPEEASEAGLKGKQHLTELELRGCDSYGVDRNERVLESLQPHTALQCLSIHGYSGQFPLWVGDSSYSNLVSLKLIHCNCPFLPSLGQLASLKDLSITVCLTLVSIGPEFYGSCKQPPFLSLEILKFDYMPEWQYWEHEGIAFPRLRMLHIRSCPKLAKGLPVHVPSLTTLRLERCDKVVVPLPRAPIFGMKLDCKGNCSLKVKLRSGAYFDVHEFPAVESLIEEIEEAAVLSDNLEEIEIENHNELQCFPLERFPHLKRLVIRQCPSLKSFTVSETGHDEFLSLNSLEINRCSNFVCFPAGGLHAPNLTELRLLKCPNLRCLPENMVSLLSSLKHLRIESCPELESFPKEGLPLTLESLAIVICNKLELISAANNEEEDAQPLQLASPLTYLRISSLPKQKFRLQHPRELTISNCRNLLLLSENMQFRFPSLVKLSIGSCPLLECSFLQGGLPSKLESLEIRYCKNVIAGIVQYDLRMLPSLTSFTIAGSDDIESLPEETLLPCSLISVVIRDLKNLKSLGLEHLTSLKSLEISDCNNLQSETLPSSLSFRRIKGCPLLGEVFKRDIGKDRPEYSRPRFSF